MKNLYLLIGVIAFSLGADLQAGDNCQKVGSKGRVIGAWCRGAILNVEQANTQCGCKIAVAVSQQPVDPTIERLNAASANENQEQEQQNQKNNAPQNGPAKRAARVEIKK